MNKSLDSQLAGRAPAKRLSTAERIRRSKALMPALILMAAGLVGLTTMLVLSHMPMRQIPDAVALSAGPAGAPGPAISPALDAGATVTPLRVVPTPSRGKQSILPSP